MVVCLAYMFVVVYSTRTRVSYVHALEQKPTLTCQTEH